MSVEKGTYIINGCQRMILFDTAETLSDVLRRLGFTSVQIGCGKGQCGACTVLLNGEPVRSCVKKMAKVDEYSTIETVEGIGTADHLHPLQMAWIKYAAVQCGFCSPGFIMSAKGLLEVNPDPTRQEVRDWFTKHNNLCRCTGYKQLVDAVMGAAKVMRGEEPREFLEPEAPERIYNTRFPRPDALSKVMGGTYYSDDLGVHMPPGSLQLALVWPEYKHANLVSIDASEALEMPGVEGVVTAKDIPGNDIAIPSGYKRAFYGTVDDPVFANGRINRLGLPICAVAADTIEHARAAAAKVKVEYEVLPAYDSYLEACKPDAINIKPDLKDSGTPNTTLYQPVLKGEDTKEIFEHAEENGLNVVEGSFYSTREPHLAIEPSSAQAFIDEDGVVTVLYKSQFLHAHQGSVCAALGLPPEKVRIVESPCGGSFGYTMGVNPETVAAACTWVLQKPVTLTLNYEENQKMNGKRSASFCNARLACDDDGKIVAFEYDGVLDHGAIAYFPEGLATKYARFMMYPYNVPNVTGLVRAGLSNQPFGTAYRGFGSPQAYTTSEALMDMMARKLGKDPFEFRYMNAVKPGDTLVISAPYRHYHIRELMDKVRPEYQKALEWKKQPAEDGWKKGVGVSCGGYAVSAEGDMCFLDLELNPDNSVSVYSSWQEMGQGAELGALELAQECLLPLGLAPEQIHLRMNDTATCKYHGSSGGSRSHFVAGGAMQDAADKLMNAMRKIDGTFRTYDEMIEEDIPVKYEGAWMAGPAYTTLSADDGHGDPMPDHNYIVSVACVEVEEATGKTRVVSVHSGADVGVIGNYNIIEGQANGGMFHAIGFALSEDYYDGEKKYATMLGSGFGKCNEIPDDMEWIFQESPRELGPHGSGGASECFQSAGHMSIINAIDDAVNVRITELPAKPEKVKAAMDAKAAGEDYAVEKYYLGEPFYDVLAYIKENPVETGEDAPVAEGEQPPMMAI